MELAPLKRSVDLVGCRRALEGPEKHLLCDNCYEPPGTLYLRMIFQYP
jgi:hypothetical protein